MLALAGLRGLSPFVLVFVAYSYLDVTHIRRIVKVLGVLLLVEFCAACVRAKFGSAIHGLTLGLAARPCGTFRLPVQLVGLPVLDHMLHGRFRYPEVRAAANEDMVLGRRGNVSDLHVRIRGWCPGSGCRLWLLALIFRQDIPIPQGLALLAVHVRGRGGVDVPSPLTGRPRVFDSANTRIGILSDIFLSCDLKEFFLGRGLGDRQQYCGDSRKDESQRFRRRGRDLSSRTRSMVRSWPRWGFCSLPRFSY